MACCMGNVCISEMCHQTRQLDDCAGVSWVLLLYDDIQRLQNLVSS